MAFVRPVAWAVAGASGSAAALVLADYTVMDEGRAARGWTAAEAFRLRANQFFPPSRRFDLAELAGHDGFRPGLPDVESTASGSGGSGTDSASSRLHSLRIPDDRSQVLFAAAGVVWDGSSSSSFRPGGPYGLFAGRDASVSLARMRIEDRDVNAVGEWDALAPEEEEGLRSWVAYFDEKYPRVNNSQPAPTHRRTCGPVVHELSGAAQFPPLPPHHRSVCSMSGRCSVVPRQPGATPASRQGYSNKM